MRFFQSKIMGLFLGREDKDWIFLPNKSITPWTIIGFENFLPPSLIRKTSETFSNFWIRIALLFRNSEVFPYVSSCVLNAIFLCTCTYSSIPNVSKEFFFSIFFRWWRQQAWEVLLTPVWIQLDATLHSE